MSFDGQPQPQSRRELREREAQAQRRQQTTPPRAVAHTPPTAVAPTRTIVVRRAPVAKKRKFASTLLSVGAMLFAGALLVGVSIPANAFVTESDMQPMTSKAIEGQSVAVSAEATAASTNRSTYTVTSYAELLRARYGNRSYSYSVGQGPVQWPFPYAVPISDGFGERVAPCRGCSSFHKGTDFTPGAGTAIYSIAAGTVIYTEVSDRGMGNNVIIEHSIGGTRVQSLYAHMQMNSSPLNVGDVVNVGDFVGLVGETGTAIGAHLHLEIIIKGVQVDPYAWLKANAAA